jgi:hypothetical protein
MGHRVDSKQLNSSDGHLVLIVTERAAVATRCLEIMGEICHRTGNNLKPIWSHKCA